MAEDVDPVRERHECIARDGRVLEGVLPSDPEVFLESRRVRYVPGNVRVVEDHPAEAVVARRRELQRAESEGVAQDRFVAWLAAQGLRAVYTPETVVVSRPAPAIRPQTDWSSAKSFSAPAGEWPSAGWWKVYGDAQLDALIEEGLAGSPSVAVGR